ncbi:dehydrogenase [Paenibacillus sp. J2TS4]|uniref:dehydrogenase n=1 Tax=Paenibacillus sp. J2TS4 TaxID=2807194 RepID=UPI001B28F276|nr:dehydrogenase [Paenibacillus sp. J2TS4]GIP35425.1 hypothetical protein J2TS4_46350 [Paenibacillus sp. J2TS4]
MKPNKEPHQKTPATARTIRRACSRELYRTIKKLKVWIPPEQVSRAEEIYYHKVMAHLLWIHENSSKRKVLADWWEQNVCPEIASLWNVDAGTLSRAFRESFGG